MISSKEHIEFLKNDVLGTINKMYESGLETMSCLIIAQAIEVLGAYLDDKPMRAKAQSAKRFSLAVYKLFDYKYAAFNRKNRLYYQLRANYIHMLMPTDSLKFVSNKKLHLTDEDGAINIVPYVLLKDFTHAINKLIKMLEEKSLNPKKVSSNF
ncbi:MAG TPA: hypothetical protein PLO05_05535 [Bacteroidales bacterium]|jgi:hypothetical protein|nr:hypothetical protein [Bacteroidales bacterium]MDD4235513.1 hypothetical protein [Bacteroidales bacterium]HRW22202.1 hypothetical protein [Bacteroidales bacterium]HXK81600.1 hypothetical protein [Bacteroidales bacterium]